MKAGGIFLGGCFVQILIVALILFALFSVGKCTYNAVTEKGVKNIANDLWEGKQDSSNTEVFIDTVKVDSIKVDTLGRE